MDQPNHVVTLDTEVHCGATHTNGNGCTRPKGHTDGTKDQHVTLNDEGLLVFWS